MVSKSDKRQPYVMKARLLLVGLPVEAPFAHSPLARLGQLLSLAGGGERFSGVCHTAV